MSIFAPLAQMDPATQAYATAGGIAVLAILLAGFFGVHHGGRIEGPPRMTTEDRLGPVWIIAIIGIYAFFVPGAVYVLTRPGPVAATTNPIDLSPRAKVLLSVAGPLVVLLAVALAASLTWPRWLTRIGWRFRTLPRAWSPAPSPSGSCCR